MYTRHILLEPIMLEILKTVLAMRTLHVQDRMRPEKLLDIKSDHANWVIPGMLMCGPYPGLDGNNFPTIDTARTHLHNLFQDGIDTFVCLQQEVVSLEAGEKHPYFPMYENYAKTIQDAFPDIASKITYLHFPLPDQTCPTDRKQFLQQISTICTAILQGRKVYVHCAGGHGRTGVFVGCLLATMFTHVDADYVMTYVQHAHDKRRIPDTRCNHLLFVQTPNTPDQRAFVRDFVTFLKFL